jgi:hypothetical protein
MNWTENVIIADADYVDSVAFNLTVNFERMIGRRIPQADMARWVECIALDGGMRHDQQQSETLPTTQVVLIHDSNRVSMENFAPGNYDLELHSKAVCGPLGEFAFICTTPAGVTTKQQLMLDTIDLVCQAKEVQRIMIVVDDECLNGVCRLLRQKGEYGDVRSITVFSMQPLHGAAFHHELLGYSLMAALGVKSSEINPDD